eukprot:2490030-Prymnesium_polylepis.1
MPDGPTARAACRQRQFCIEPHADPTRHRSNAMGPAGVCAHADVCACGCMGEYLHWHACSA